MRLLVFALIFFTGTTAEAAYSRSSNQVDTHATLREVLVALEDLKHEVRNHEEEIRTFEEKARTFEEMVETLRMQQVESLQAMRESLKNATTAITAQESASKGLTATLQNHASDSAAALSDYKRRIGELEKSLEVQNHNIENLQAALKSLTEALQVKDSPSEIASEGIYQGIYQVKSGDSLEKIARHHNTTIKKIKELNNLTSDQIRIGQKLQLPQ